MVDRRRYTWIAQHVRRPSGGGPSTRDRDDITRCQPRRTVWDQVLALVITPILMLGATIEVLLSKGLDRAEASTGRWHRF